MKRWTQGNTATEPASRHGWFIGHFIEEDPLRRSRDVEVKWGRHEKGETNAGGFVANVVAQTMSVLISGRFRLWFEAGQQREQVELSVPGDYAVWDRGVFHSWEALEDSVVLTVRWPSLPKDQEPAVA